MIGERIGEGKPGGEKPVEGASPRRRRVTGERVGEGASVGEGELEKQKSILPQ